MIKIGERIKISVDRQEANFDRACDAAHASALSKLGIDEYGHSNNVSGWNRSNCFIFVEFEKYTRIGNGHIYAFTASAERNEDFEGF